MTETKKKFEEKHAKAEVLRNKMMKERAERIRLLTKKVLPAHSRCSEMLTCVLPSQVEEVRQYKKMLMEERRELMANKLAMAEEKRQVVLRRVVRKAHEEETKVRCVPLVASSLLSSASRCLSFCFCLVCLYS